MTATPADDGTGQRLALVIGRLVRMARQDSPTGMTASQMSALGSIGRLGLVRISDLAATEGVALPVMTRLVASLLELDLVQRRENETDKRSVLVELSEAGKSRLTQLLTQRVAWADELLESLTDEERDNLLLALPVLEKLALK